MNICLAVGFVLSAAFVPSTSTSLRRARVLRTFDSARRTFYTVCHLAFQQVIDAKEVLIGTTSAPYHARAPKEYLHAIQNDVGSHDIVIVTAALLRGIGFAELREVWDMVAVIIRDIGNRNALLQHPLAAIDVIEERS